MQKAVIYARYSSFGQTEQSIEGQMTVCNKYAEQNDILVVDHYIDRAITGTTDNRAEFQRMLRDSNKRVWDIVLVYKLDRFSRNKYEAAIHRKQLKDNGIKLISATENIPDTPEGIILESLLEGMAEYYSAELSQKVKRGQNESRKKGNFTGGSIIYGYRSEGTKQTGKKLVINENEANVVRYIFNEFIAGRQIVDIHRELNEKGIYYNGKPFAHSTIYRLVSNEKYSGVYRLHDEVYENIYPAIISKEVFEKAKIKLDLNKYGKHKPEIVYLLKNKLVCGYCGKPVNSDSGTSKSGKIVRYYKCTNRRKRTCELAPIRKELIENLVIDTTTNALCKGQNLEDLARQIIAENKKRIEDMSILNLLLKQKESVQRSIDNILKAIERGIVTDSTKERLELLERQKSELETKIMTARARGQLQIQEADIVKFLKTALKKDPLPMITLLVKKVVLYNDKVEIYYNYTDSKRPDDEHRVFSFYSTTVTTETDSHKYGEDTTVKEYKIEAYI